MLTIDESLQWQAEQALVDQITATNAKGGMAAWTAILAERTPIYEALADYDIDTSRRSVARIVEDITERFGGTR